MAAGEVAKPQRHEVGRRLIAVARFWPSTWAELPRFVGVGRSWLTRRLVVGSAELGSKIFRSKIFGSKIFESKI